MYEQRPPDDEERFGCLDALLVTRIVFGYLLWPMLMIVGIVVGGVFVLMLFTVHPALALIPLAVILAGVLIFARWEQRRPPPTDF